MQVDDLTWPVFVLAALGAEFDIEGPDELVTRAAEVSALFGRAVAG